MTIRSWLLLRAIVFLGGGRGASRGGTVFKKQAQGKPEGGEVQADQAVHVELCLAVIPGAPPGLPEKPAGTVFRQEDQARVDAAAADSALT